jgi:hypothetical protein
MTSQQEVARLVQEFAQSGAMPPELTRLVEEARSDSQLADVLMAELKKLGADEVGSGPPLDIASFYRDGPPFDLRWELPDDLRSRGEFDQFDRKTQFYILFAEWTRRELEGMSALNAGDNNGAKAIFEECLARARQLDVGELEARSYENLLRVAEKTGGDRAEQRRLLECAKAARQRVP